MRRVVLVGCGHAHLEVVRGAAAFGRRDAELILVDPGRFWYSGLGSGVLGGRFTDDEATIDPARLVQACGASLIADRAVGLDAASREVLLESGRKLAYDLVSFNVGSRVPLTAGLKEACRVKPIASLPALREAISAASGQVHAVVVGGGATGSEIAGNLLHLGRTRSLDLRVTLLTTGAELVESAPRGLRAAALASLTRRGASVRLGHGVDHAGKGTLTLLSGETIGFDHLILATGLSADPLVADLGLPARAAGLRVDATLVSIADDKVFAAGDCAAIEGFELPKIGVYGVRAGPVLLRNLLAALDGRPLEAFRPQRNYLSVLDLADGEGLAMRAGYWTGGRLALRLKNHLDRSFLERYRRMYARV